MWDKIKKFAADAKTKAGELATKGLAAAPDLAKKAAVGLRSSQDFEDAKTKHKRFAVVFGNRTDLAFQKILATMPIYLTKAWISSVSLKTMELDDYTDFAKSLNVSVSPTVLYYKQGELLERHEGVKPVGDFLGRINTL